VHEARQRVVLRHRTGFDQFELLLLIASGHAPAKNAASEPTAPPRSTSQLPTVTHLDHFTNDVLWLQKNPALYYALNALIAPK
jgi:hypothetical protein